MGELIAYLDGTPIGVIGQSAGGSLTFTYDESYRLNRESTPLSLSLPLVRSVHKNKPVRAFLQGLLPDSPGRLAEIAREYRTNANNPFALLSHIGRDAAGAVQLLAPGESSDDAAQRQGDVRELPDSEFAEMITDLVRNRDTWGKRTDDARWSLPGAQPKVALFRTAGGRWAVPQDSTPTTHILKPAIPPYSDHHINEFMTMGAARELGMHVAGDFLEVTEHGDAIFVAERYDRELKGARWHRLHQEDLCQALSVPPENKYQIEGGPGVAEITRLLASLPEAEDRRINASRFFDALVFSVASLGTDAHAKNYSLLLRRDRATLAPLYDLGSYAPYVKGGGVNPTLAMSIAGEYSAGRIRIADVVLVGVRLGIAREHAEERAREITNGIMDAYSAAGEVARAQLGADPFIAAMVDSIRDYAHGRGWTQ
ncbi:HipA domain-containing protein [Microbacterium murale]|uniref:Transcriptional regulator n=1 Tax=Microbacterium murale TaxID=1081040 RepID=A0ABQ1S3Y7_9MICO|nr:HipA domain-containing protein [Microbacterium murale]GGD89614.1 transcriptional regulator [Microbacterium murale]